MKVKVEVELGITAKAVLREGQMFLSVTGTMPLTDGQERGVSASVDSGFSEKVTGLFEKAFDALIKENQGQVIQKTRIAQGEALGVAARMGEL